MEDQAASEGFTPCKKPAVAVPKLFFTPPAAAQRPQQTLFEKLPATISKLQLTSGLAPRYEQQQPARKVFSRSSSEAGDSSSEDIDCDDFHIDARVRFGRDADADLHIQELIETELDRPVDFDVLLIASRQLCPNPRDKATVRQLADQLASLSLGPAASVEDNSSPDCSAPTTGCRAMGSSRAASHRPETEPQAPQQTQQGWGSYTSQQAPATDLEAVSRTLSEATMCSRVPSALSVLPSVTSGRYSTVSGGLTSAPSDHADTQQVQCVLLFGNSAGSSQGTWDMPMPRSEQAQHHFQQQLLAVVSPELLQLGLQKVMLADQSNPAGVVCSLGQDEPESLYPNNGPSCAAWGQRQLGASRADADTDRDQLPGLGQLLLPESSCPSPILFQPGCCKADQHSPTLLRSLHNFNDGSESPQQATGGKRVSEVSQDDRDQWDVPLLVIRDESPRDSHASAAHSSSPRPAVRALFGHAPTQIAPSKLPEPACVPRLRSIAAAFGEGEAIRERTRSDAGQHVPMLTSRTARQRLLAGAMSERDVRISQRWAGTYVPMPLDISEWLSSDDELSPASLAAVQEEPMEGETDEVPEDLPCRAHAGPPILNFFALCPFPETHEGSRNPLRYAYLPTARPGYKPQSQASPPWLCSSPGGMSNIPPEDAASEQGDQEADASPAYEQGGERTNASQQGNEDTRQAEECCPGAGDCRSPTRSCDRREVTQPLTPVSGALAWLNQAPTSPVSLQGGSVPAAATQGVVQQDALAGQEGAAGFGACSQQGLAWSLGTPFDSLQDCIDQPPAHRSPSDGVITDPTLCSNVNGLEDRHLEWVGLSLGGTLASTEASEVRLAELVMLNGDATQQEQPGPITVVVKAYREERVQHAVAEILSLQRLHGWSGCVQLLGFCGCSSGGMQLLLQPCDCNLVTWAEGQRLLAGAAWGLQALSMFHQLAVLLSELHTEGMAHCDLKPQNVLMLAGRPLLADLSEARARHAGKGSLQLWEARGTEAYAAAEMHAASAEHPVDAQAADVWSLGCTLYELLTGKMLFEGSCSNMRPVVSKAATPAGWLTNSELQLLQSCCGPHCAAVCRLLGRMCCAEAWRLSAAQVVQEVAAILA